MWEPVALCCFSRRTGCLVLGSLEVIEGILSLIIGLVYFLYGNGSGHINTLCSHEITTGVQDCEAMFQVGEDRTFAAAIVCALVQVVFASMMIHGVRKNDHCLMAPFLIKNMLVVICHIVIASILVPLLAAVNFLVMIPFAYIYGALIFMWTYFLLTVRAYYYELQRGKGDDHHKLLENEVLEPVSIIYKK